LSFRYTFATEIQDITQVVYLAKALGIGSQIHSIYLEDMPGTMLEQLDCCFFSNHIVLSILDTPDPSHVYWIHANSTKPDDFKLKQP
jgi:hypothetical protein